MVKYYADSEEKYLKSVLLYGLTQEVDGESINRAYYDTAGNKPVYDDDMAWEDMFIKGLITFHIIDVSVETPIDCGLYKPVGCGKADGTGPLSFVLFSEEALVVSLFSSEEYNDGPPSDDDLAPFDPGLGV